MYPRPCVPLFKQKNSREAPHIDTFTGPFSSMHAIQLAHQQDPGRLAVWLY